jgi:hypothetical protein
MRTMMNTSKLALFAGLAFAALACDEKKPTSAITTTATVSVPTPVATATATAAPTAAVAAVEEDVETEEDHAVEADAISKTSMEAELAKIENELKK